MESTSGSALRVGLVGYGLAGEAFHAPLLAGVEGLRLTAVVTSNPARAAAAQARYPGVAVVATFDELLAEPLDLVVVASPNHVHAAQARACLEAGFHVVVDKPVAPTAAEAADLHRLAEARGRVASAFHNRRWDSDFLTLRALLDAGRLGDVRRFESRFESWSPTATGGWRESGDPAMAGGLLYDLGTHLVDQAVELFGAVARVYAEADVRRAGVHAPDDVFVSLRHEKGVLSHLWTSKVAADLGPRMRVLGSQGAFVAWGLDDQVVHGPSGVPAARVSPERTEARHAAFTRGEETEPVPLLPGRYADFYRGVERSIRTGSAPPVPLAEAAYVLEVVAAAQQSAREGDVVVLRS